MDNTQTARCSKYWLKKGRKYVGPNKPFPSESQFVSSAIQTLVEKLEEKQK